MVFKPIYIKMSLLVYSTCFLFNVVNAETTALTLRPTLTLEVAKKMAEACRARQIANKGAPVSIAIFDDGANLVLFHRMTGASLGSVSVAMAKGKSSAHFAVSTRQLSDLIKNDENASGIVFLPNITAITGGVPIMTVNDIHLGGIGVSGSSSNEDEACALDGLAAVSNLMSIPESK